MNILVLAALMVSVEPAAPRAEVEYQAGTLAYDALVVGDLARAEQQLRASQSANRNDPAWQINYGQLLARQGRVAEAADMFRRVALAPDSEIVLANGEVIGTREASRRAARRLRSVDLSAR